jgi:hypothetical protein
MTVQTCPKCGGQELGKGKQNAYGHMYPVGRVSLFGTEIQHIICTSCGLIVESYVTDPERFKGTMKS